MPHPTLQQTDRQTLIREAMTATTKQLDRNSRYADPEEARDNRFQRDGGGGIGITVERTDDKKILIRAVQDGSPSAKAGVQAGDQILAIDGESMVDRTLGDVVARLRGTVGAPVTLTVLRPAQGAELALNMKRGRIIPTTVTYERRGDVALIHLTGFNSATTDNLHAAIDKARAEIGKDMAGVIIDMRSNRGGLLDQAQTVSEMFINDGTIFSTQGRHPDSRRIYKSSSCRKATDVPIVVLMNGGSASAAEIVAAALQDRGRAVVVGTTSYGKGTVQTVVRLANEGELILTWSRLQAPSGYTWNELGVLPNICTSKVGRRRPARARPRSIPARAQLMRWHALRNPDPPGSDRPAQDLPARRDQPGARRRDRRPAAARPRPFMPTPCRPRPSRPPATRPFARLTPRRAATTLPAFQEFALQGIGTKTMAKPTSILIKMVSSADTGFFYVTKKNPRTKTEKLELKKYDPVARKHVVFKESKIK